MTARHYFPQLDGLRFFAFFLVYLGHIPRSQPALLGVQSLSWAGVDLFFMLSAFLLTSHAVDEFRRTGDFSPKRFLLRRILRIWPLYYLALILGWVVFPLIPWELGFTHGMNFRETTAHLPFALVFLSNVTLALWPTAAGSLVAPLWTINVEEQFYVALPLVLLGVLSSRRPLRWALFLAALGWLMSLIFRISLFELKAPPAVSYSNLLPRLDSFMIGMAMGFLSHSNLRWPSWAHSTVVSFISFVLGLGVLAWLMNSPHPTSPSEFGNVWIYLFTTMGFAMIFVSLLRSEGPIARFFSFAPFRHLGKVSYGLYVFHPTVLSGVSYVVRSERTEVIGPLGLLATFAVAQVTYQFFEKRFLELKPYARKGDEISAPHRASA